MRWGCSPIAPPFPLPMSAIKCGHKTPLNSIKQYQFKAYFSLYMLPPKLVGTPKLVGISLAAEKSFISLQLALAFVLTSIPTHQEKFTHCIR